MTNVLKCSLTILETLSSLALDSLLSLMDVLKILLVRHLAGHFNRMGHNKESKPSPPTNQEIKPTTVSSSHEANNCFVIFPMKPTEEWQNNIPIKSCWWVPVMSCVNFCGSWDSWNWSGRSSALHPPSGPFSSGPARPGGPQLSGLAGYPLQ